MSDVKTWAKAGSTSPATPSKTSPKAFAKGETGKKPKIPLEHVTEAMEKKFQYEFEHGSEFARASTKDIADHFHISLEDALKLMKKAQKAGHVEAVGRIGFTAGKKYFGGTGKGENKQGLMLWERDMSGGKNSEPIKTYDPKTGKSS